ncbi:MAG: glycosyltransferase family 39 protein [Thermoanaerobaculia bacterium]
MRTRDPFPRVDGLPRTPAEEPGGPSSSFASRHFTPLLLTILVVAALVRLHALDRFSYWLDEILQTYWLQGTWDFFWRSLKADAVHPPLDYLMGRLLESLAPVDWVRKVPAVCWGVGTVATVGVLMARRVGAFPGLLSAGLLALAPFHVRYSQELRPYSLGLLLLCISLLALDSFVRRPSPLRLALLFLACLGTAYALYLAAVVLAIAAAGILMDDVLSRDENRSRIARRFLTLSPLFGLALLVAYLPWWNVVLEAARRPAPIAASPVTWQRAGRTLAFFALTPKEGVSPAPADLLVLLLAGWGLWRAMFRQGTRFLAFWVIGGIAAVETLWHIHPHWDATRRYLPAGLAVPLLLALGLDSLRRVRAGSLVAGVALAILLVLDLRSLALYFRSGRFDWRPLARHIRASPASESVFTENQYSQLCAAFYVVGPRWLFEQGKLGRPVSNLEGQVERLGWSWPAGSPAWLVITSTDAEEPVSRWAKPFSRLDFPAAEGARLYRLDPALRPAALGGP